MNEIQVQAILKTIDVFKPEDALIEVRSFSGKPKSGYFRDKNQMLLCIDKFPNDTWYFVMNKVKDECYSREQNEKILQGKLTTTSDKDVDGIDWILIDCDPVRATGISASNEEKEKAKQTALKVYEFLKNIGFSYPVVADSGNGYHLLYKVHLVPNEETTKLIKDFLYSLDCLFSDEFVNIDTAVFNPSRITKLYGTVAKKGSHTEERPHRMSGIIKIPDEIKPTSAKLIEKVSEVYREQEKPQQRTYTEQHSSFDLRDFIAKHNIRVKKESRFNGGIRFVLEECLFDSNHKSPDSAILLRDNGVICYKCFHNSCQDKGWKDVRLMFEPDAYDKQDKTRTIFAEKEKPKQEQEEKPTPDDTFLSLKDIEVQDRSKIVSIPTGFTELDKKIIGMNKGDFSIWSGGNGSGKSTVLSQLALETIDRGFKVAIFSGELSASRMKLWLHLQAAGRQYALKSKFGDAYWIGKEIGDKIDEWADGKLWIYNNNYGFDVQKVMNDFEKHINEHQTDVVIIDNLMSLDIHEVSRDKYEGQSIVVLKMAELAKKYNIHLHFVCHPRKATGFLRKTDISGTADLSNSADNVFMVHRVNNDFKNLAKQFIGEKEAEKYYNFSNVIEIMKNRDLGHQDEMIGLYFEVESKRLLNGQYENKVFGWEQQANLEQAIQDLPF